jgi:hypothetical protein
VIRFLQAENNRSVSPVVSASKKLINKTRARRKTSGPYGNLTFQELRALLIKRATDPAKCRTKASSIAKLTDNDISKKVVFPYESFSLDELKSCCRAKARSDEGEADVLQKRLKGIDLEIRAKQMQGIE